MVVVKRAKLKLKQVSNGLQSFSLSLSLSLCHSCLSVCAAYAVVWLVKTVFRFLGLW